MLRKPSIILGNELWSDNISTPQNPKRITLMMKKATLLFEIDLLVSVSRDDMYYATTISTITC